MCVLTGGVWETGDKESSYPCFVLLLTLSPNLSLQFTFPHHLNYSPIDFLSTVSLIIYF